LGKLKGADQIKKRVKKDIFVIESLYMLENKLDSKKMKIISSLPASFKGFLKFQRDMDQD